MSEVTHIPRHIGYILDGNRRWAKQHGLPAYEGHLAGYNALKEIIEASADAGIRYISVYAFSTENWKRSKSEVSKIMSLVLRVLKTDLHEFVEKNIRILVSGSREGLTEELRSAIEKAEADTVHLTRATVCICFNYGGQQEITQAVKKIVEDDVSPEEITEEVIASYLYAPDVPPLDIVVRTSGEQRISNFMLWRIAYSEFIFLDKFWPDMASDDVTAIINEYQRRSRRFGG